MLKQTDNFEVSKDQAPGGSRQVGSVEHGEVPFDPKPTLPDNPQITRKHFLKVNGIGAFAAAAWPSILMATNEDIPSDRYQRGWEKLKEIDSEAGTRVLEALKDISPDLGRYTIEFPFGDVYSRGVLSLKEREIATIAALAALGNAQPQLKVHIHGALNVGCTRKEVLEVFIQLAVYAGFPAALNATFAAKEVFQERDKQGVKDKD